MATERLDIVVREDGSRVVKKNIEDIGKGAKDAAGGTNLLKQALAGLGVATTLAVLQKTVDTYSSMISRLRLVTTGTENLATVNDRLFASANRTRSSYEATTELFAKLSTGARQLGVSQTDLLQITETVNQAIAVSGASATEAAGGLRQLGQAIASGTLRGDELNSILENMPRLAQAIADGMGITVGQLRAVGSEGKITAQAIIDALKDQAPTIAAEFAQVTPTIASAFQVLENNFTRFVGQLDQATGFSAMLAGGIILLANNLDVLVAAAVTAGIALLAVYGPSTVAMLTTATRAVQAFTVALASNPLGLLLVTLAAATTAVLAFGDSWSVVEDNLDTTKNEAVSFKDVFLESFGVIASNAWAAANENLNAWDESLTGSAEKSSDLRDGFVANLMEMVENTKVEANFIIGLFVGTYRAVVLTWSSLPAVFKDIGISAANFLIDALEKGINKVATILIGGPLAPFINGGQGLQLINIPRLENDAQNAARVVGGVIAGTIREATTTDWIGNAIPTAIKNVQDRNNAAGVLNGPGQNTTLPAADKDAERAAKKREKELQDAADLLARFRKENQDNILLSGMEADARRVTSDLLGLENQLKEKNVSLTGEQRSAIQAELETMYRAQDVASERDRLMEQLTGREKAYSIGVEALNQVVARGAMEQDRYNQAMRELDYNRLVGNLDAVSGAQRGLLQVQMEQADEAARVEQAYAGIWREANGPLMDYRAELTAINALLADGQITGTQGWEQQRRALSAYLGTLRDFESGWRRAAINIGLDMTDAAANIERVMTNAFGAAEDALTDFLTTGKADFQQFFAGLQEDLTRSFVREQILGPLASAIGLSGSAVGVPLGEAGNPMHVTMDSGSSLTNPSTWWKSAEEGGLSFFDRVREGWAQAGAEGGNFFQRFSGLLQNLLSSLSGGSGGKGGFWSDVFSIGKSIFSAFSGAPSPTSPGGSLDGLFATGTSFRVAGAGGVDSQKVSFWASPGEDVTVSRPGSRAFVPGGGEGGGDTYSIHVDARGSNDEAAVEAAVERGIRNAEPVFLERARRASARDTASMLGRQKL